MKRLRMWLINTCLPAWAKVEMMRELQEKQRRIDVLEAENAQLYAYIDGLRWGIRTQRRITINNGEEKK